ncbi:helix-turn-helix transcriptional regulator [Deinococcus sp. YIM 77859]|uniref:helix-turn-helix transcriptional regulator n=1 Tax=Deinococcus sp. YIM 77859 TaxID=1540221 RepID=UPI000689C1ED|nr:helix-turn-helix transcriptional regulator [Deinococcus sp. YIM 77859]
MQPLPPIVLDDPPGKVLHLDLAGQVVLTRTRGLPYLWDVLERSPLGLLVQEALDPRHVHAILERLDLQQGKFFYLGPALAYLPLTPCERRALRMIAFGLSNAEIASRIGTKTSTVHTQVSAVLAKLGVNSRHAARDLYWGYPSSPLSRQLTTSPPQG